MYKYSLSNVAQKSMHDSKAFLVNELLVRWQLPTTSREPWQAAAPLYVLVMIGTDSAPTLF